MTETNHRHGITSLTIAWLVLLAAVTAGTTYVVLARQAPGTGSDRWPGVTLAIPAPDAAAGGGAAGGAEDPPDRLASGAGGR